MVIYGLSLFDSLGNKTETTILGPMAVIHGASGVTGCDHNSVYTVMMGWHMYVLFCFLPSHYSYYRITEK